MTDLPTPPAVSIADAEIAQRIAASARTGRPVDRTPTVEQLLAAFGEEPGAPAAARERVERALQIAGVGVRPGLADAAPGTRITLSPGPGAGGGGRTRPLVLGLVALGVVIAGVAVAASMGGGGGGGRASSLPAGTTSTTGTTATTATTSPATGTTTGAATAPGTTTATAPATTATAPATTATTPTPADAAAAAAAKRAKERRARRQAAARLAAARRKAAARRRVTVSLTPAQPTYLCVDDAAGKQLFGGTLTARRVFKAARIRVNIGLSSVTMRVDGRRVPLNGSPTGYLLLPGGKAPQYLPLGQRPSC